MVKKKAVSLESLESGPLSECFKGSLYILGLVHLSLKPRCLDAGRRRWLNRLMGSRPPVRCVRGPGGRGDY